MPATAPTNPLRSGSGQGGFTISELVVVLVVLAGLIAIVVVSVRGIDRESADRECRTELRTIKAATDQFKAQAGFYPPDDTALEVAHVLDRAKTPNWKVVTKDQDKGPEFLPEGSRCAGFSS